ncbi:polysaccharide deacetylase [Anaerobacillus arseniciselenatis]|uniref:Polysaccharide deacetylase n=1 Tax=Anaerobacillus arseniciselenatis TaxID=85682 RepID=A0A1S2LR68_9BACI|nr:polysaccharide deacetylase [Anaerobacillus arseniciselenatis]
MYDLKDSRWITNYNQLKPADRKIVLTFDDGPSRHLESFLNILSEKDCKAVFFWQSRLLHKDRLWKRVLQEGHQIGAHSINHKNLAKLTKEQQYKQIKNSIDKIEQITGKEVNYFRPPFGQYNEDTMSILVDLDVVPIMWEISSFDWENKATPTKIVCNVANNTRDGSIILMHELEQTVAILPDLIDRIREMRYDFTLL